MTPPTARSPRRRGRLRLRGLVSAALLVAGLLLAAAFVGVSAQWNAIARERDALQADIVAAQHRQAQLEAELAAKSTDEYVIDRARDYGWVRPGEALVAVQQNEQAAEQTVAAADAGGARLARWIAFFFGER
ncbi:MAG TPA: septum formation initiator family protein, partial [Candidatus Limnocylindrales bacterium]|nr:septum formation initiator family protein [Candidatus Limnocylindrales bacterium]